MGRFTTNNDKVYFLLSVISETQTASLGWSWKLLSGKHVSNPVTARMYSDGGKTILHADI